MKLKRVISGGQIGADMAGLLAARSCNIETGGWAPKGWMTKRGCDKAKLEFLGLKEHSVAGYPARTAANVLDSDATIRFANNFKSPGERCTLNYIKAFQKPHLDIFVDDDVVCDEYIDKIVDFLEKHKVSVLNVAGNANEYISTYVYLLLCAAIEKYNRE